MFTDGSLRREKAFKEAKGLHQHAFIHLRFRIRDSEKVFLWWENHRRGSSEAGVRHSSWEAFLHLRQLRGKTLKNIFIHYVYKHTYSEIFLVLNKADGFHYRQPWVIGVQEQIESLTKRLEEAEEVMKFVPSLKTRLRH